MAIELEGRSYFTFELELTQSVLQANNISAAQIRDDYERRRAEGLQDGARNGESQRQDEDQDEDQDEGPGAAEATQGSAEGSKKHKRNEGNAVTQLKLKRKHGPHQLKSKKKHPASDDEQEDEETDHLARGMYKKSKPLPGQLENCERCSKRFTVTPYSKSGPEGGLLCTPCGKEIDTGSKSQKLAKKTFLGKKRRKLESDRLDGKAWSGPKTLQQLCIEKVALHHVDVEEFGDLPQSVLGKLGEIFTKTRVLNSSTLKLFLRPDLDTIAIHDAAYLEPDDFEQIFAVLPRLRKLVLQNACQFKDETMEYMIEKTSGLEFLQLYAANLVTDEMWHKLFRLRGQNLKAIKLQWLDVSFGDDVVCELAKNCTNLKRLKLKLCRQVGVESVDSIAKISTLEHLSLQLSQEIPSERLVNLISCLGPSLRTLSLEKFLDADDDVLATVHTHCRLLSKFRFSENDLCTDAGFAALFTDWANLPLVHADFNRTRDVDNSRPDGPEEPNGLASEGFKALMAHSGSMLESLNIASCRHISHDAFSTVFDGKQKFPALTAIDLSFCSNVDTVVVVGILKSCPALKKLTAFGCFKIERVIVPAGKVLIGVPNAHEAIEQYGHAFDSERMLGTMVEAAA